MGELRMIVKTIDSPGIPGGKALALCSEDGQTIGMQSRCVVDNEATNIGTITVTFYIDGESIRFADNDG